MDGHLADRRQVLAALEWIKELASAVGVTLIEAGLDEELMYGFDRARTLCQGTCDMLLLANSLIDGIGRAWK